MIYNPEDLEPLEVTLLGVLCLGLPPSRAAGDDTFRVDHVAAVTYGLQTGAGPAAYLGPGGVAVGGRFREELRATITALTEKGLIAQPEAGLPAAAGGFEAGLLIDTVNPDEHPVVLDRFLAQACMELLLRNAETYPYLMQRYAHSGEVWRRLRQEGYLPGDGP